MKNKHVTEFKELQEQCINKILVTNVKNDMENREQKSRITQKHTVKVHSQYLDLDNNQRRSKCLINYNDL